jgi:outer membrane protein OmpA-like peptidoglycan-associated protein
MTRSNKISLIFAFFLLINVHYLVAQDANKELAQDLVEMADEAYQAKLALDVVRAQYEQAAQLDPTNIKANFFTGELYIQRGPNKERSTEFLLNVLKLDPDYRFDILYKIGQGYQFGLEFNKAIDYFQQYKTKLMNEGKGYRGEDKVPLNEVERRIYECQNGIEYVNNPEDYSIVNIGSQINSPAYDFAPVLNEDETILIFTTRRQENNINENVDTDNYYFEDIFISRKQGSEWQPAENIGDIINTQFHDSNLALSADGKTLYLYRDDNGGDIYYSDLMKNNAWSIPEPISGNVNSSYFENAVSITQDRQIMFFSSDRPGGFGGRDIYMCTKDSKGNWSRVSNVGEKINTPYDDEGPFIDYQGKTLYFSSRGHDGMGGFDIYKSEYDSANQAWGTPVNLGYPINTPDDDIYFVITKDGKRGYYSSVKDDGMGYTDIYSVTLPDLSNRAKDKAKAKNNNLVDTKPEKPEIVAPPVEEKPVAENTGQLQPLVIMLQVQDKETGNNMDAKINMRRAKDNVVIPVERIDLGLYRMSLVNQEAADFLVSAERSGYIFINSRMKLPASSSQTQEIPRRFELMRFETGAHDILRNIYFNTNKATFTKESYNELNKMERMLFENPAFMVNIEGHTDNVGNKSYNLKLSQNRAKAVVNYLIGKGIDSRRLKWEGFGESKPLASNDDEKDGREINRRVEFTILGEGFR